MTEPLRPFVRKVIRLMVVTCLGGLLPSAAVGQTIVWTDANARKIQRKDVTGGEVATIVQFPSPQAAYDIHYDPVTAKLYYVYAPPLSFQRANLDGSEAENIPTPTTGNFTLNVELRKLYWIYGASPNVLYRSELNGSGPESHTYPTSMNLRTLEAVGDDLFFGVFGPSTDGIWRADADGSNEQRLHDTPNPEDLAYDPVENKLYMAGRSEIFRINPDGTGFQLVHVQAGTLDQIEVDARGRKLYWTLPFPKVIQRSNLDGSNVEDFVTASDVGNPNLDLRGLTIVYTPPIPTLSGWGLMAMAVLLLGAGLVVLRRQFNLRAYPNIVTLSAAKGLRSGKKRFFAALRMTTSRFLG